MIIGLGHKVVVCLFALTLAGTSVARAEDLSTGNV
jgi:hypothetical protein